MTSYFLQYHFQWGNWSLLSTYSIELLKECEEAFVAILTALTQLILVQKPNSMKFNVASINHAHPQFQRRNLEMSRKESSAYPVHILISFHFPSSSFI